MAASQLLEENKMVPKKSKSKRQTLQAKYRIVKRTREHKKRLKKGLIVNFKKKSKPDNRIPNDWPYKEDLLKEIQNAKDRMEEVKIRQKEKRREEIVIPLSLQSVIFNLVCLGQKKK